MASKHTTKKAKPKSIEAKGPKGELMTNVQVTTEQGHGKESVHQEA